jgi:hypothetical protein
LSFFCNYNGISQTGRKTQEEKAAKKEDDKAGPRTSTNHDREENILDKDKKHWFKLALQENILDDTSSRGTHTDKALQEEFRPNYADDHKLNRPMSPGTLALMCDEQDTMFTTSQNAVSQETVAANQNTWAVCGTRKMCSYRVPWLPP